MPIERVYAHPDVSQDAGRVALQRGPLVYCLEQADNLAPVGRIALPGHAELAARFEPDLLGGVVAITGQALVADAADWPNDLYRPQRPALSPCTIKAIPYYAWDNRASGAMQVWMPEIA